MDPDDLKQSASVANTSSLANTSNSNLTVNATSNSTGTSNLSNNYWTTWTSPYVTTTDLVYPTHNNDEEDFGRLMVKCLTEKEIENLLDTVKAKAPEDMFKEAIYSIIKSRHCSEEFILKYLSFENIDVSTLRRLLFIEHEADILSGNYAQIALYLSLS